MYLILVPVNTHSHSLFDICRSNSVSQINYELSELLNIYYVLSVFSLRVYYLGAPGYLGCGPSVPKNEKYSCKECKIVFREVVQRCSKSEVQS
jgi:hypothetical protein